MKKIYEYLNNEINKTAIKIEDKIKNIIKANKEDILFEDTRAKTELKIKTNIKDILELEFNKFFMLGQTHGIYEVKNIKNNTYNYKKKINEIAEFAEYIETQEKIKKIYKKENEPRVINSPNNNAKDFIGKEGVIPTPITKLNNFKEYIKIRERDFGKKITDNYFGLFPSYPKEIRNKYVEEGKEEFVKLQIEKETKRYMDKKINPNIKRKKDNFESIYIEKIKKILNIDDNINKIEKQLKNKQISKEEKNKIETAIKKETEETSNKVTQIAVTELRAGYGIGRILSYAKMGIKFVKWSAEPEHLQKGKDGKIKICNRCMRMDGKIVPLSAILSSNMIISPDTGESIQPFLPNHPYCACVYLPIEEDINNQKKIVKIKGQKNFINDLVEQNNNLLGKALGIASIVGSIGLLVYALRNDIKDFIRNGLLDVSINEITKDSDSFEEEKSDESLPKFMPNVLKQLDKLGELTKDITDEEIFNILEKIAPQQEKAYIEAITNIKKEEKNIIKIIRQEQSILDEYSIAIRRIGLEIEKGSNIEIHLSELISMKTKLDNDLKNLEKLRYEYSNDNSFLLKTETELENVLEEYYSQNNINEKTKKYLRGILNKAEQLQENAVGLTQRINFTINKLRDQEEYINSLIGTVKNKNTLKDVAKNINEEFFNKKTPKAQVNQATKTIEVTLTKIQGLNDNFDIKLTPQKLKSLEETLLKLQDSRYPLTLQEYSKIKNEINYIKIYLQEIEKTLSKFNDIDLDFMAKNSENINLKQLYEKIAVIKNKYNTTKKIIYDLDYSIENKRRIQNKNNIVNKTININKRKQIINDITNQANKIKNIIQHISHGKNKIVLKGNIDLLISDIKKLENISKYSNKERLLLNIEKEIDKKNMEILSSIDDENTKRIVIEELNNFKNKYIELKNGYENLEFNKNINIIEFNKESIIEKEVLEKIKIYVNKFPKKYTRFGRLF